MSTNREPVYITSLLQLLQILMEQNAQLRQEIDLKAYQHRTCLAKLIEIRTPLTVIRTSSNIVQRYYEQLTPEKRQQHLNTIDNQVEAIVSVLDQIGKIKSHHRHANDT
jgi:signal transduction histidine kinase